MTTTRLSPLFHATTLATDARSLTDGVKLVTPNNDDDDDDEVILPWVGFGTYRLGQQHSYTATLQALRTGYRSIDTAFIYGRETTEMAVGRALQTALSEESGPLVASRRDVFVTTKQWRNYHGYDATWTCCRTSLQRLQLDYIDLYLMHWPGPAWNSTTFHHHHHHHQQRRQYKDETESSAGGGGGTSPWPYAKTAASDMAALRAETWRAMEDLQAQGIVRAIGVSNFTIRHLERLRQTARVWPPAVNQVECHPLFPQNELRAYCRQHGIVLQAYAALGGQDGTKKQWTALFQGQPGTTTLRNCHVVTRIAQQVNQTPAQVLLRYALQRNCVVIPKTSHVQRMQENAAVFHFALSQAHMQALDELATPDGRLCWRTDPLRLLDFE